MDRRRFEGMKFSRTWAMPDGDTFNIPPIGDMVKRYLSSSKLGDYPLATRKHTVIE